MPFSSQSKLCFCSGSNSKSLSAVELFLLIPKGLAKPRYRITNFNHLLHHLITQLGKVCESGKPSGLAGWLLKRKIEKTSRVKRGADCPRLFSKLFAEQILPFECLWEHLLLAHRPIETFVKYCELNLNHHVSGVQQKPLLSFLKNRNNGQLKKSITINKMLPIFFINVSLSMD